jgi:hypothetical protein
LTSLSNKPPNYHSYILRCWVETNVDDGKGALCRYSLEEPHTEERLTFQGLESLMAYLQARATECGPVRPQRRSDDPEPATEL